MVSGVKKIVKENKFFIFALLFGFIALTGAFADDDFGVASAMQTIVDFLMSPWVKGIIFIALAVECILLVTEGRADGQAFKKFIPVIAGTILLLAAPKIVSKFTSTLSNSKTSAQALLKDD